MVLGSNPSAGAIFIYEDRDKRIISEVEKSISLFLYKNQNLYNGIKYCLKIFSIQKVEYSDKIGIFGCFFV